MTPIIVSWNNPPRDIKADLLALKEDILEKPTLDEITAIQKKVMKERPEILKGNPRAVSKALDIAYRYGGTDEIHHARCTSVALYRRAS